MRARFGDRLTIVIAATGDADALLMPSMLLQPLVENAIRHGVERMANGDIDISVTTTSYTVVVRISNPLPPAGGLSFAGHQVGLNATQVRIEALTDGRGSVQTQVEGGRFIATVRLPVGV
jgi:two-component system sensor histidine kinase AlgZ